MVCKTWHARQFNSSSSDACLHLHPIFVLESRCLCGPTQELWLCLGEHFLMHLTGACGACRPSLAAEMTTRALKGHTAPPSGSKSSSSLWKTSSPRCTRCQIATPSPSGIWRPAGIAMAGSCCKRPSAGLVVGRVRRC